jgi:hypothetical protein
MNINDRELLARTLQAEAGNQGYGGMLAAGSVIMNRANASGYGSGLRGVILKPGQFSAWNSTTGYAGGEQGQDMANMRASDEAYKAADALISGAYDDVTGGATHYYNPAISQPKWGQKAGGDWKQIGDHVFGFADAGKKPNLNQAIASDTMRAIGKSPKGILATTQTSETETKPMIQRQKSRGLLESLGIQKMQEGAEGEAGQRFFQRDTFKDTAARMAPLLASMGSSPALQKATANIAAQRTEGNARNKTADYLRANGMSDMAELMLSGQISARDVGTALMNKKLGAGSGQGVQSSSALRDRSGVVLTMRDGSIVVKTAGGETISGDAALEFVRDSEEAYAAAEKSIYGARTAGTLGAEAEFGAAAEAAKTSGKLSMELGFDTLDKANAVLGSLSTIDSAIAAIDGGAKVGPVYKMLPNITESSAALSTAMNQMGLDVISSVTFGALSEGEMKLAMETAVPRDLGPEALRSYLVKKRDAQAKAAAALQNAARYLTKPGNSISGWLDQKAQQQGSGTGAMPSTASGVSDDPLGIRE